MVVHKSSGTRLGCTQAWLRQWPASSSRIDSNPRFSPDGRRVAFVSNRSGAYQIWIANRDGGGAFQLTSVTTPYVGSPSWSPDGSTILFDGTKNGHFEVYAISAAGGTPRRLIGSSGQDAVASFSRDGRWIYFTSNRTGEYQIDVQERPAGVEFSTETFKLKRGDKTAVSVTFNTKKDPGYLKDEALRWFPADATFFHASNLKVLPEFSQAQFLLMGENLRQGGERRGELVDRPVHHRAGLLRLALR